jgi:hypothetical protein
MVEAIVPHGASSDSCGADDVVVASRYHAVFAACRYPFRSLSVDLD